MDSRIVLTLDAGGTNFCFTAIRDNCLLLEPICVPSEAHCLERCLNTIVSGFERVKALCPEPPVAISFAFPGPADYPAGIIGDPPNLPGFRGGVALGPMLQERFGLPVFINNDGDLFAYGEAIAGFLPFVNEQLQKAGSPKRYRNLLGVTLGTGFGAGIVRDGRLFLGDNSIAGEAWLLRNKRMPDWNAEEGASIRAVRREYALAAGITFNDAPQPKDISEIAAGRLPGHRDAAREAFRRMGEVAGDAVAQALTLVDGLVVIGGGMSAAHRLFLPALVAAMNDVFINEDGEPLRRLVSRAYNAEDQEQFAAFLCGEKRTLTVPGSVRTVEYDPLPRTIVGVSRLGTSPAVAVGAYAFALSAL